MESVSQLDGEELPKPPCLQVNSISASWKSEKDKAVLHNISFYLDKVHMHKCTFYAP